VTWLGNVTDGRFNIRVNVPSNASVDGTVMPAPLGAINYPNVRIGNRSLGGSARGYDSAEYYVEVNSDPFYYDVKVYPTECKSDCTYDGVCDFSCIGQNGCQMNSSYSAPENLRIAQVCQFSPANSTRVYNTTHMVQCCVGPVNSASLYQTPLLIQSCSPRVVPHKTLVNLDGRLVQLTVLTYQRCEQ
jgi:hypothetical protein